MIATLKRRPQFTIQACAQTDPRGKRGGGKPCVWSLNSPPSPLNEPLQAKTVDFTILFSSLGTQTLHDSRRAVLGLGGSVSVGRNAGIPIITSYDIV